MTQAKLKKHLLKSKDADLVSKAYHYWVVQDHLVHVVGIVELSLFFPMKFLFVEHLSIVEPNLLGVFLSDFLDEFVQFQGVKP